eukprot:scaffold49582_cov75-Phaeocystis_antarctica.AAC.4
MSHRSKMRTQCVMAAACALVARAAGVHHRASTQWSLINGKTPLAVPVSRSRALYSSIYAKIHP